MCASHSYFRSRGKREEKGAALSLLPSFFFDGSAPGRQLSFFNARTHTRIYREAAAGCTIVWAYFFYYSSARNHSFTAHKYVVGGISVGDNRALFAAVMVDRGVQCYELSKE
jgi:hypothetical protein